MRISFLLLLLCSCARASGTIHAEVITANDGTKCYAIIDQNGDVRGGNCP